MIVNESFRKVLPNYRGQKLCNCGDKKNYGHFIEIVSSRTAEQS
jgi:hypothetical protein